MSVGGREIRSTEKDQSLQVGIARRKEEPSLTNGMKTSISDLDGVYIYIVSKMIILWSEEEVHTIATIHHLNLSHTLS